MNSLNNFKIYYLDKEEVLIRTDCQAIISFFNESAQNKPSRVRWVAFTDFITGLGIDVQFQHIEGKDNTLADALSLLVCSITGPWTPQEKDCSVLAQVEEALIQLKKKPDTKASQHLKDLINCWTNMRNSAEAEAQAQGSLGHKKKISEPILKTLSGRHHATSSTVYGNSSSSMMPRKQILNIEDNSEVTSTLKIPSQK
ncbi:hypothetical protein ZIOFF_010775 [Zingiber officinale]|uniref:Reverse transcriptase RNase H-like domain-containing protein n=1 Tax=Zingiber officinale TaxID=94328 RepID=A0A8J5HJ95_ZINOF|nr:hypothetical protein ZIOFF_010775 [Zingiber officinale]